jgi:ABC-type transport system involved in multi-copper enzyme maturation permease subunit
MLLAIIRKEVLVHVLSLRLAAGAIFALVLFTATALVLSADHQDRVEALRSAAAEHRQEQEQVKVYSDLRLRAFRPLAALGTLCQGVERSLPGSSSYSLLAPPSLTGHGTTRNPLLVIFPRLDLATVVQVVLSLLALVFAYDAFSGERASGTLALTLANPVSRATLLLGKYLGAMAVLAPLLVAGLGLSLAVLLGSSYVSLSAGDWLSIVLIALLSLAYLSVMLLLGLLISAATRRPGTSLVTALFVWVVLVLLVPQGASQVAAAVSPLPSARALTSNEADADDRAWQQILTYADANRCPLTYDQHRFNVDRRSIHSGSVPMLSRLYSAPREYVDWALAGARFGLPQLLAAATEIEQLRRDRVLRMADQADLAQKLRLISPAGAYYDAVAAVTGTGHRAYVEFFDAAVAHRRQVVEHARANDGLDYRFFTRPEALQLPPFAELEALERNGDQVRLEQLMGSGFQEQEPLDLSSMPPFRPATPAPTSWLGSAAASLISLIIANLLLVAAAALRFSRADVRRA